MTAPDDQTHDEDARSATDRAATAAEILALIAAPAAGFLAPTDWCWTLGLVLLAVSLFLLGFFGLADR